ncbi:MAG TPA: DNA alkylation repair protein, partial [Chloroflexota bacterium]|nr:DNA alkylation repair protein [Chloroflexota bacterium]
MPCLIRARPAFASCGASIHVFSFRRPPLTSWAWLRRCSTSPSATRGALSPTRLIASHRAARSSVDAHLLERLADGMADWGAVDTFSCLLAGPAWRTGLVSDEVIAAWALSPSRWWRRAALVST